MSLYYHRFDSVDSCPFFDFSLIFSDLFFTTHLDLLEHGISIIFFFKERKQINKWQNLHKKMIYYETKLSSWQITESHIFRTETLLQKAEPVIYTFFNSAFSWNFFFQCLWFISHSRRWLIMVVSREITNNNNDSQNTLLPALSNESSFS